MMEFVKGVLSVAWTVAIVWIGLFCAAKLFQTCVEWRFEFYLPTIFIGGLFIVAITIWLSSLPWAGEERRDG